MALNVAGVGALACYFQITSTKVRYSAMITNDIRANMELPMYRLCATNEIQSIHEGANPIKCRAPGFTCGD
eukprot:CAMPEP_0171129954 /NCGR_PEP_ID=MMETSP0766_2-20121228/119957_1 /TAXON_ID=439317 /ORGANISM="Gambierdiscus australes, Strain CAWD 149" /LENGTH=70 /DNA_ID=CAMNT_0011593179 /DNA_START=60 /DNA_END=269 /DNA_ORIENTATION=+